MYCLLCYSGSQSLDMLGAMLHKVSIRATDDSYRTTRERMTLAEEESKKQRSVLTGIYIYIPSTYIFDAWEKIPLDANYWDLFNYKEILYALNLKSYKIVICSWTMRHLFFEEVL